MDAARSFSTARCAVVNATPSRLAAPHRPVRVLGEQVHQLGRRGGRSVRDAPSPVGQERVDLLGPTQRVLRLAGHAVQEVAHPGLPLGTLLDATETRVVFRARGLEVCAEVEERRWQDAAFDHRQRDEEPPDPAVPVQEGMDRLELVMRQRHVDQRRHHALVEELLPGPEAGHQLLGRGRHIARRRWRGARRPDPVLGAPELPGYGAVAPHSRHELGVELPHQPEREWQPLQPGHAVLERRHVVAHLAEVGRAPLHRRPGLGRQQLPERGLRALDPAGQNGLPADERPDEEVRVRELATLARQAADLAVGLGKRCHQVSRPLDRGGQGIGNEGGVPPGVSRLPARRSPTHHEPPC